MSARELIAAAFADHGFTNGDEMWAADLAISALTPAAVLSLLPEAVRRDILTASGCARFECSVDRHKSVGDRLSDLLAHSELP